MAHLRMGQGPPTMETANAVCVCRCGGIWHHGLPFGLPLSGCRAPEALVCSSPGAGCSWLSAVSVGFAARAGCGAATTPSLHFACLKGSFMQREPGMIRDGCADTGIEA